MTNPRRDRPEWCEAFLFGPFTHRAERAVCGCRCRHGGRLRGAAVPSAMDTSSCAVVLAEEGERLYHRLAQMSSEDVREWVLARCTQKHFLGVMFLIAAVSGWALIFTSIEAAAHKQERAAIDSPRTPWSSKRAGQIDKV